MRHLSKRGLLDPVFSRKAWRIHISYITNSISRQIPKYLGWIHTSKAVCYHWPVDWRRSLWLLPSLEEGPRFSQGFGFRLLSVWFFCDILSPLVDRVYATVCCAGGVGFDHGNINFNWISTEDLSPYCLSRKWSMKQIQDFTYLKKKWFKYYILIFFCIIITLKTNILYANKTWKYLRIK